MQRSELAHKIATEKCLTFRGETICNEEFSGMVADMLNDDVFKADSTHISAEKKDFIAAHLGALNLQSLPEFSDSQVEFLNSHIPSVNSSEMPSPADEEGCCSSVNPYVPENVAPIVLVMNIFMPGVGTILASYYDPSGCNCKAITCGIFQMMTVVIMIGWIWSIWQGAAIYKKSKQYAEAAGQA